MSRTNCDLGSPARSMGIDLCSRSATSPPSAPRSRRYPSWYCPIDHTFQTQSYQFRVLAADIRRCRLRYIQLYIRTYINIYVMYHRRFSVTVPRRCRVHQGSGSLPLARRGPRVQSHACLRRGSSCVPEERGRASMHASRARLWDDTHTCLTNVQLCSCTS